MEQQTEQQHVIDIPSPETLYAAVLYLATAYAKSGCPRVCHMIMRQLACILNHPSDAVSPMLRETCRKLHDDWAQIAQERTRELGRVAPSVNATSSLVH